MQPKHQGPGAVGARAPHAHVAWPLPAAAAHDAGLLLPPPLVCLRPLTARSRRRGRRPPRRRRRRGAGRRCPWGSLRGGSRARTNFAHELCLQPAAGHLVLVQCQQKQCAQPKQGLRPLPRAPAPSLSSRPSAYTSSSSSSAAACLSRGKEGGWGRQGLQAFRARPVAGSGLAGCSGSHAPRHARRGMRSPHLGAGRRVLIVVQLKLLALRAGAERQAGGACGVAWCALALAEERRPRRGACPPPTSTSCRRRPPPAQQRQPPPTTSTAATAAAPHLLVLVAAGSRGLLGRLLLGGGGGGGLGRLHKAGQHRHLAGHLVGLGGCRGGGERRGAGGESDGSPEQQQRRARPEQPLRRSPSAAPNSLLPPRKGPSSRHGRKHSTG